MSSFCSRQFLSIFQQISVAASRVLRYYSIVGWILAVAAPAGPLLESLVVLATRLFFLMISHIHLHNFLSFWQGLSCHDLTVSHGQQAVLANTKCLYAVVKCLGTVE
jgi:hypothetical protein